MRSRVTSIVAFKSSFVTARIDGSLFDPKVQRPRRGQGYKTPLVKALISIPP